MENFFIIDLSENFLFNKSWCTIKILLLIEILVHKIKNFGISKKSTAKIMFKMKSQKLKKLAKCIFFHIVYSHTLKITDFYFCLNENFYFCHKIYLFLNV